MWIQSADETIIIKAEKIQAIPHDNYHPLDSNYDILINDVVVHHVNNFDEYRLLMNGIIAAINSNENGDKVYKLQ